MSNGGEPMCQDSCSIGVDVASQSDAHMLRDLTSDRHALRKGSQISQHVVETDRGPEFTDRCPFVVQPSILARHYAC